MRVQIENDLASLEQFREMRNSHTKQVDELKAQLEAKAAEHELNLAHKERKYLAEKSAMQKVCNVCTTVAPIRRAEC
jgi:hypothetical protein